MDKMPFYELEELLDSLKALNEKEEEQRKKQEKAERGSLPNLNMSSYQRQLNQASQGFRMPSMPNFNL